MSAEEDAGRGAFAPLTASNLKRHNRLCAAADAATTPGLSDEERRMRFCADFARDQLERVGLVWRVPVRIADGVEAATAPVHALARHHQGDNNAAEPHTIVIGHLRQGDPTPPATARVVARMSPRDAAGLARTPGAPSTPAAAGRPRNHGGSGSPAGKRAATAPRLVVPAPVLASPAVKSTGRLTIARKPLAALPVSLWSPPTGTDGLFHKGRVSQTVYPPGSPDTPIALASASPATAWHPPGPSEPTALVEPRGLMLVPGRKVFDLTSPNPDDPDELLRRYRSISPDQRAASPEPEGHVPVPLWPAEDPTPSWAHPPQSPGFTGASDPERELASMVRLLSASADGWTGR